MSEAAAAPAAPQATAEGSTSNTTITPGSAGAASEKKQEAIKQEIRRLKLKVNGSEREMAEHDVIALAQKAMGSDEKFRKASERDKRIAQIVKAAESDPEAYDEVIRTLFGKDPEEIYKQRLAEKLKRMSMDPKDLELHEAKEKLRKYEAAEKKREEEAKAAKMKAAEEHYTKEYDKQISEGLKSSGLPINEDTIRMTAEIMLANLEGGMELPISTVMELVRERYQTNFKKLFGDYDPDKLLEFLGKDLFRKMQDADAKRRPSPDSPGKQAMPRDEQDEPKAKEINSDDFRERIRKWSGKE